MAQQIQLRKGTASQWTTANPTLAQGEPGAETDTGKLKIGDGSTAWTSLAYCTNPVAWTAVTGKPTFATVATSGAYSDLTGKPTLATVATSGAYTDLTGKPSLAAVATSGSASDLSTGTLAAARLPAPNVSNQSLTGTQTVDMTGIDSLRITLTGNLTLTLSNLVDGKSYKIHFIQDATGSRTVTLNSQFKFGTDVTSYTATTTASKRDLMGIWSDGTNAYIVGIAKGY